MGHAALAFALCASATGARADHAERAPVLARLSPDPRALHDARVSARERRLAQTIAALPDVARVAVQLTIPDETTAALDRPMPPPGAALVLALSGPGPADDALFSIVHTALPGLTRAGFAVSRHPLAQPIMEKAAEKDHDARTRALAASLACNVLLSAFLVFRTRARRIGARPRTR